MYANPKQQIQVVLGISDNRETTLDPPLVFFSQKTGVLWRSHETLEYLLSTRKKACMPFEVLEPWNAILEWLPHDVLLDFAGIALKRYWTNADLVGVLLYGIWTMGRTKGELSPRAQPRLPSWSRDEGEWEAVRERFIHRFWRVLVSSILFLFANTRFWKVLVGLWIWYGSYCWKLCDEICWWNFCDEI